ncbi:MAG TPA: branched-chain-amino-acid transaminase [Planctomycetaceae bacterium]|nr:branched-chain-amino-acid transaminase [Planctomycetaceae bacterium]
MSLKVYINGTLFEKEAAKISVYDHGLLYGDGVFEGMRSYGGNIFRMQEHLDRLWNSAEAIWLEIPLAKEELADAVNSTLAANGIQDGYVRLLITRGAGTLGLEPDCTGDSQVIIIADHITLYPDEYYQHGLKIITATVRRNHPAALDPRIKSLNYLNNILAKIEGLQAGCVETLMLNHRGEVAECTGDNIFLVKSGCLVTPMTDAGILEGITRQAVIDLAHESAQEVRQVVVHLEDVYQADECFLTGSAAEVVPVVQVDEHQIGNGVPGPVTRDMMKRFQDLVNLAGG